MLLASNYFLLGDFFSRRISIGESGARSVTLHRVNSFLHNWYTRQIPKSFDDYEISDLSLINPEIVSENLSILSDYYKSTIEYYDFNFKYVNKYSKSENSSTKVSLEKNFINSKHSKKLGKKGIKSDVLLDSFSAYPVIPINKETEKINYEIFQQVYPKIKSNAEIIILSGELVWSGWLTMDIVLNTINDNKLDNKIFIIDSWGLIQQLFCTNDSKNRFIIQSYDDLIDSFTTSLFLTNKVLKTLNDVSKIKSSNYPLYANSEMIKTFPSGVTHKPDYTFHLSKKYKVLLNKTVISIGIDEITPLTIPKSILEKAELIYNFPAGSVIQKYEGENVTMMEDIGLVPSYVNQLLRLKLPKQLTLKVKDGQFVKKGDVIAERAVLKNMLREKVLSPYTGFLNSSYFDQGILLIKDLNDKKQFLSDFEGEILSIEKSETAQIAKIRANSFSIEIIYKIGNDAQGRLMRMSDVPSSIEAKILLVKPVELSEINSEFIINNNVKGVIVDSPDYTTIRRFIAKVLKNTKVTTICVLNPFSIQAKSNIIDILYLFTGNSVIISNNRLHLLIDQQQSKQILMRLKSKDTQGKNSQLKKGEHVLFFNYSHQDPYARIENVSPQELVLNTERGIVVSSFTNIIKYTSTFYDSKNK
ncbi:hypothetical protein KC675_00045 [Candidatus Dojkabacteria bacterium]|uniref:Uncharacterized protein n=1 Tax=Candidatus Dojkabacteria bacterium TaxID=2099670 RepID=A0A955IA94_9BACT|nr:hypothetical protein [Candidatus Dojkabacteria bacterium]